MRYRRNEVDLNIVRAYDNVTTDIAAYADSGIPKAQTYIIGSHAGESGTQPIRGDDTYHCGNVVQSTQVIAYRC